MPAIAIASTIPGKAIIMSEILMITASITPPKYPAITPRVVPIANIEITSISAALSDILVP